MSESQFKLELIVVSGPVLLPTAADRVGVVERRGETSDGRIGLRPSATRSPPVAVSPSSPVALSIHRDLAGIADDWRAFESEAAATAFQAFDWLAKWQKHIGASKGTVPAIVAGRDREGRLLFIFQLAVETSGPVRRLTWLGSDLCDYNAPLLAARFGEALPAGRFPELWREIVARLRAEPRLSFGSIDLQKMPEMVGPQSNPFLDLAVSLHASGAYVATLGSHWEAFYAAKRSSSTRKRERRQLNQLAEHGAVRLVNAEGAADIDATLDALFNQKSSWFRHRGVEDIFARPGYRAFYRDVATDPRMRDLVHVSRLDVGPTVAAANLGLRFGESYYLILSSYLAGNLSQYGTGRFHLQYLLRYAIEQGFKRFDFTVGDEPYKHDWCDVEVKLYDFVAAVTLRGAAVAASVTAYRKAKRAIKQSPALWQAFSRARALAGSWSVRMGRKNRQD